MLPSLASTVAWMSGSNRGVASGCSPPNSPQPRANWHSAVRATMIVKLAARKRVMRVMSNLDGLHLAADGRCL